ncbi:MAG: 2-C-methyl-D-erythritol 4-phosphate cytidylyltransferase [Clostridiales bacterium]|nr:2-C-methyl-D-erythritol 4-phosphate cytidylyltransferase [Clostridiales bacterium]
MKNVAIILAGGIGRRIGNDLPKQFIVINNKPIIVHTIMNFQNNNKIDDVLIVCVKEWIGYLQDIIDKYHLTKVKWIIEGGNTVHDSTKNGVFFLHPFMSDDDYVVIHDAARPILPQKAIDEMLDIAHREGNASLAIPSYETVIYTEDQVSGVEQLERNKIMRIQTPQAYSYSLIRELYEMADKDNIHDIVYADILAVHYGKRVFFSRGFTNNIKVTRQEDISLVSSLMNFSEEELFNL